MPETRGGRTIAGRELEAYAARRGWTTTKLAAELDLSYGHLARLINGGYEPSLPTAVAIERLAGIPPREWFVLEAP